MKVTKTVDKWGVIRYKNEKGEYHREDGPAWVDGKYKEYWFNGKLHRTDGPAVIFSSGNSEYYLDGKYYTRKNFEDEFIKRKLEKIKEL